MVEQVDYLCIAESSSPPCHSAASKPTKVLLSLASLESSSGSLKIAAEVAFAIFLRKIRSMMSHVQLAPRDEMGSLVL